MSAVDIEKEITITQEDGTQVEEWLELGNGCECSEILSVDITNLC